MAETENIEAKIYVGSNVEAACRKYDRHEKRAAKPPVKSRGERI
jgi:hypothetical protein